MSSVYAIVTNRIIEQLENGVIPWRKPWREKTAAACRQNSAIAGPKALCKIY